MSGLIPYTNGGNGDSPFFIAYRNGDVANAMGNSVLYNPVFNATYSNVGSFYDTTTGIFTAGATGLYTFNGLIYVSNVAGANTTGFVDLVTTFRTFPVWRGSPASIRDASGNVVFPSLSISVPLALNETAKLQVQINGGAQTITFEGTASPSNQFSFFSGFLVAI